MKAFSTSLGGVLVVAAIAGVTAPAAEAQVPVPRVDLSGSLGWFLSEREEGGWLSSGDVNHRWVFGADGGYYWTEHLKSEVGISATSQGSSYVLLTASPTSGHPYPYVTGRLFLKDVRLTAQQLYQFGHNAWLHPYVGAGIVVQRERARIAVDAFSRLPERPLPADRHDDETGVRPVVSAGLKAYVTPRGFVRADLRASPWTRSRDFSLSIGLGMDVK